MDRGQCFRNGTLKHEKESLVFAAQEQATRTNVIKGKIDKLQKQTKCRMCGRHDETINYIASEHLKLAQREYKRRHNWIGRRKFVERMEFLLNQNGMSINQKWSLGMTLVKSFGILLYRKTIL